MHDEMHQVYNNYMGFSFFVWSAHLLHILYNIQLFIARTVP